ncbi:MAG TPA: TonB-dependent receptor [Acidobacteriaceae bacterium]|nr:TonB-dependent receptor [Acidobacteriaceae bacterium]
MIRKQEPLKRDWVSNVLFALVLLAALFGRTAAAQGVQQFEGHVADSSGAAIPGATVTVHSEGTGTNVVVKTSGSGDYTVPYLKVGRYSITTTMADFESVSKTHINLDIDQTSKMDFTLPNGNVSETVTVNADGAQIELAKADRGEVIEYERVQELPLDGRNAFELFALSPGTQITTNPLYQRQQDSISGGLIVNGVSINPAAQYIDNLTNDNAGNYAGYNVPLDSVSQFKVVLNAYDASYGRSAGSAVNVSVKSGTNNVHGVLYEYALRPFLNANLWTYDYAPTTLNAKHRRDQFGVQLDGPIVVPHLYNGRDKAFFELQWDQAYESLPSASPSISSVPNPAWLTGNFQGATYFNSTTNSLQPLIIYDPLSPLTTFKDPIDGKTKTMHQPFPNNIIPTTCTPIPPSTRCSTINPVGAALAQFYAGLQPNYNPGPGFAPYSNNLSFLQVESDISRNGTVKLDYVFSDRDRATLRWGGYERADTNPSAFPASNPANSISSQVQPDELQFALEEIHTFSPNLIMNNKAIVSTYKQGLTYGTRGDYLSQLGFSANFISQAFTKNMIPNVTASSNLGPSSNSVPSLSSSTPGRRNIAHEAAYEPDVTYIRGRHTIRAGFDLRLLQYTTSAPGQNNVFGFTNTFTGELGPGYAYATGYTAGNSIASLLIGDPNSGSSGNQINPFYSQHYYGMWVQDDLKLTSKLTLNIGVRYDLLGARTERRNQVTAAFNSTAVNPVDAQVTNRAGLTSALLGGLTFAGVNGVQRGAYATNLANIAPRFGAAYAFSDRTSLRFGFGEFFVNDETVNGSGGFSSTTSYTNSLDSGLTPYGHLSDPFPAFVQAAGSSQGLATGVGGGISFVNPNYQIPSVWQYSASVEQLLSKRDTLDISLTSTRAHGLPGSDDLNHISAAYQAQCDPARGAPSGARLTYCDGTGAPAKVASPFYQVAGFSGTSYYTTSLIGASNLTRPFPEFTNITETNLNIVHSWYNSMQVTASHRASHDLTFHFAYTWSKNMQAGAIIDTVNRVIQRQIVGNDRTNVATISGVYYLPLGRGKAIFGHANRLVDALIGGYEVAPSYQYLSGEPFFLGNNFVQTANVGQSLTQLPFDATHAYNRLRVASPCVGVQDQDTGLITPGNPLNYVANNCTAILAYRLNSAYSVQQNVVYSGVRNPSTHYFDASISKRFTYNERVSLQLRLDANNALNHPNFSYGSGSFSNQSSVPDAITNDPTSNNFGTIQKGPQAPGNLPREIQLAAKLIF